MNNTIQDSIQKYGSGEISAEEMVEILSTSGDEIPEKITNPAQLYDEAEDRSPFWGAWGAVVKARHVDNTITAEQFLTLAQAVDASKRDGVATE